MNTTAHARRTALIGVELNGLDFGTGQKADERVREFMESNRLILDGNTYQKLEGVEHHLEDRNVPL